MIQIDEVLTRLVHELRKAGVKADVEPAKVPVPGAWVTATQVEHNLLGGGGTVTCEIYLVVRERPTGIVWRELSDMYALALTAVSPSAPTRTNEAVQLHGPNPLPAFVVTTQLETC